MHPEPTAIDPMLGIFWDAISARGWCEKSDACCIALQNLHGHKTCLFRTLLSMDAHLSNSARRLLEEITKTGISLVPGWSRAEDAVDVWLGRRFYFSASANFAASERFISLVSSQLGRNGGNLPNWPTLVDAVLQHARRDRERPLILSGTSLSEATQQFSDRADLSSLNVQIDDRITVSDWLDNLLDELESAHAEGALKSTARQGLSLLKVSPPSGQTSEQITTSDLTSLPLQDRVAFALADRIMAIHIRSNGTIAKLAEQRLADDRFPTGSIYIASTFGHNGIQQPEFDAWLARGAVGWLLQEPLALADHLLANCRKHTSLPFTQSICLPLPKHWSTECSNDTGWPYLTHCTRGNSGPLPTESQEQFRDRAWSAGVIPNSHPLSTLQQILHDQRIKGNAKLTRSSQSCVSFSEVPLTELLSRRQYRSHLGRWDWEPYGIMIRREALEEIGARAVVYGEEADYNQLSNDDKPYFQPRGTKNTRNYQDWTIEREWRLLSDLNLADLPHDSIIVFVATRTEAQQVARRCPWPVVNVR